MSKEISSPFSTGGGGHHFETQVQSFFVTLMLTRGCPPIFPTGLIDEIKLQARVDGYQTDDLIVFVKNGDKRKKLLVQIKSSIRFTQRDTTFAEVLDAAWKDFTNKKLFSKDTDKIILITGPISKTDISNVSWILEQAKVTKDSKDFYNRVGTAKFSPPKAREKLEAFRIHLTKANGNNSISDECFYHFLSIFHLLGMDLGREQGGALSLIQSLISQYNQDNRVLIWGSITDFVQSRNQSAGTIRLNNIPSDLIEAFRRDKEKIIPADYVVPDIPDLDPNNQLAALAVAALLGNWDGHNDSDTEIIRKLTNEF